MKNSEIAATIADYRRQIDAHGRLVVYDSEWMTSVIETLLARQDDLAKHAHPYVLATDYAALEAENAELKARLARYDPSNWDVDALGAELDENERRCGAFGGWVSSVGTVLHLKGYLAKQETPGAG